MRDEEREGKDRQMEQRGGGGGLTYGVGRQICVTPRGSKLGDAWPAPQATEDPLLQINHSLQKAKARLKPVLNWANVSSRS